MLGRREWRILMGSAVLRARGHTHCIRRRSKHILVLGRLFFLRPATSLVVYAIFKLEFAVDIKSKPNNRIPTTESQQQNPILRSHKSFSALLPSSTLVTYQPSRAPPPPFILHQGSQNPLTTLRASTVHLPAS